jgi:hypothetical protein
VAKPSLELSHSAERLLSGSALAWRRAGGGYTPAERWVVQLADGRSAFVKAGVDDLTAGWLRVEYRTYAALRAPFQPALLGWQDGPRPILVLEDLSGAAWPPPWDGNRVEAVRAALALIAATPAPTWVPQLADSAMDLHGWQEVADDPQPFLALGLASPAWLAAALPDLIGASDAFVADGLQLLHLDVRSDNICIRDGHALLVDWNHAAVGNARLDVALWLPSLADEGGLLPDAVLPDAGPEAAIVSGYFAARAGRAEIPTAPRVRHAQLAQLRQALPWASRELRLPPLA